MQLLFSNLFDSPAEFFFNRDKIRPISTAPLWYSATQEVLIDMQENLTPEYLHLFNVTTKAIESLQGRLIAHSSFKTTIEDENIAFLQNLQLFLIKAQQDAEDIFLDRTD